MLRAICVRCLREHVVYEPDGPEGHKRRLCGSCIRRLIDGYPNPEKKGDAR